MFERGRHAVVKAATLAKVTAMCAVISVLAVPGSAVANADPAVARTLWPGFLQIPHGGDLRAAMMIVCALMLVAGFLAMLFSVWKHHRRASVHGGNFHGTVATEVFWAMVPCAMVGVLVWPVVRDVWSL